HRAGRHGKLELRPRREPRHRGPPVPLQLRDGSRPGDGRVRGSRPQASRAHQRRDRRQLQREQPARVLRALAPVHGSGQLGRAEVTADSPALERLLLKQEVEDFLYREAELLDERRYEEWLDLFTDDARYFMPMRRNVPADELEREFTREGTDENWFDEGKDTLASGVKQDVNRSDLPKT